MDNGGIHIYKVSEYDYISQRRQFDALCAFLREHARGDAYLIGNISIGGVELDALLITPSQVRIIVFKNMGGSIVASERGPWTSDGRIIATGTWNSNPFRQAQESRAHVTEALTAILSRHVDGVKVSVLFFHESHIDSSGITDTSKQWLDICDMSHPGDLLVAGSEMFHGSEFADMPRLLNIADYASDGSGSRRDGSRIYGPESAGSFYEELRDAMTHVPHYDDVYRAFDRTFRKVLNQNTCYQRIAFGGVFAQTDYLLKENDAPQELQRMVNDARVRLRRFKNNECAPEELAGNAMCDCEALCSFIALIYKVEVPPDMTAAHVSRRTVEDRKLLSTEERFIVDTWNDTFLYGHMDGADDVQTVARYADENKVYPYDWSYLTAILYRDAQLNLVRPREENGVIYPELIIFEPDYLVNVTSIASCFEEYGNTPFTDLINRFKPNVSSEPTLLGNFAGQLLDEEIRGEDMTYRESAKHFMANNVVPLLSTPLSAKFHSDANVQKQHIHKAFSEMEGSNAVKSFRRDDVVLEPSFFCPMLGIQGRIDLLQLDFKFLIEQKSGKSAYPYPQSPSDKVRAQDKHYVQMLLYMALIRYNYSGQYERNNKNLQAFLLYSKYDNSLCGLSFAPELLFEAFRIRNLMVWCDIMYARDGYTILDHMTAGSLNRNKVTGRMWNEFQKPQIERVLSAIHEASPLERAYFYRFLAFISKEQMLSKIGSKMKDGSGFASTWLDDFQLKLEAGNIYHRLTLDKPDAGHKGEVSEVVLHFQENSENDMSNFRKGDIVMLYPYEPGKTPDACASVVMRCSIMDIQTGTIMLQLRAPQSDNRIFTYNRQRLWAIEHDYTDASYGNRYRGMHAFLNAPQERRDLLLLQREPRVNKSLSLIGDYNDFNTLSLKVKQARDLFLIIGPPGTGKTSYGMLNTLREELLTEGTRVLLVSYTNRAVDEMCGKLIEEGIDFIRVGSRLSTSDNVAPYLLDAMLDGCDSISDLSEKLDNTRVIAGTTTTLSSCMPIFRRKAFSLAIIDEASQILEPDLMSILSAVGAEGLPCVRKLVFIGDHKQLPAVVQQNEDDSKVSDAMLNEVGLLNCRLSLFERLLRKYRNNPDVTFMLTRQGRMHPDIAQFPNYAFYHNKLDIVPLPHQQAQLSSNGEGANGIADMLATRRIAFVAVDSPTSDSYVSDKVNRPEAEVIAQTVYEIYMACGANFDKDSTVGIIVPYRNQIATIRHLIDERFKIAELHDITIDTVERFQGSQRDYIIYGFTVQKYYQLGFLANNTFEEDGELIDRKMNVAMTRAREHLIMVGNPVLLNNNFTFSKLIEYVRSRQGYFEMTVSRYISGQFTVPPLTGGSWHGSGECQCSASFSKAFDSVVVERVKASPLTRWPDVIFGNTMTANMEKIGYGKIDFTRQLTLFNGSDDISLSPEQQVLIYCCGIMRTHYCSSMNIYGSHKEMFANAMAAVDGRAHFIDLGCGPSSSGIAFAELFLDSFPEMSYVGIDISESMRATATDMLGSMFGRWLNVSMLASLNVLGDDYWLRSSESPAVFIFNISYLFSCVTPAEAELTARRMCDIMRRYPLNRYYVVIEQSHVDSGLESYKVFRRFVGGVMTVADENKAAPECPSDPQQGGVPFCYEIYVR